MSVVALQARTLVSTEALKWIALGLMVIDHVNTFLLDRSVPAMYAVGRIAFPIFAIVLAWNLARPGIQLARLSGRLLGFGFLAAIPLSALGMPMPLNVMFTFAAAVLVLALWDAGWRKSAVAAFFVLGILVDYGWPGLSLILAVRWWFLAGTPASLAASLAALVSLYLANGNLWALGALPVIAAVQGYAPHVPRLRWAFYAFYPAHFVVLAVLAGVGAAHG